MERHNCHEGITVNQLTRKHAASLCITVLLAFGFGACGQQKSASPAAPASAPTAGGPLPEPIKPPLECSAASNAADCADILNHMGKDPAAAFGRPGHEPSYADPDAARLPPCKNGTSTCEVWERMWPQ